MAKLMPSTLWISPDEPAHYLVERNLIAPDSKGVHRYMIVYVYRDGELAEWRKDLGLAREHKSQEFRIPSLGEHTVGELWDIAEHCRLGDDYWQKRTVELQAESTLITDFLEWVEERDRIYTNRTVIGPGYAKQRNGAPSR